MYSIPTFVQYPQCWVERTVKVLEEDGFPIHCVHRYVFSATITVFIPSREPSRTELTISHGRDLLSLAKLLQVSQALSSIAIRHLL